LCWPLTLIIAILAAIIIVLIWVADSFEDACGIIVGVITAAASIIWNIFVTLLTLIVRCVVSPLANAWDIFANFLGNLFVDPISTIIRCFETLGRTVLGILETIARGIDAVFGSNLTSAVQGWKDKLSSKSDELVERYGNGKYEQKSDVSGKIDKILNDVQDAALWNTFDAYNTGYDWGKSGGSWIKDKLSGLGDLFSLENIGEKLGLDFSDKTLGGDLPLNYDSPEDILGNSIPKDVGNIADNTADISDSMDLTNEDLDYLRRIADMEWKKEFTTANITVDMSNYNTINGENDLDGIVTKLADKLYDEMHSVANGVYV
jgi:hypothetical protein